MRDGSAGPRPLHAAIQLYGLSEIGYRARAVARLIAHDAAVEKALGVARIDFDDGAEIAQRGCEIALLEEDDPPIKQGVDVARVEFERFVVIAPRAVEVSLAVTGDAADVPGGGESLIGGDCETEVRDGAFDLALFSQELPRSRYDWAVSAREVCADTFVAVSATPSRQAAAAGATDSRVASAFSPSCVKW